MFNQDLLYKICSGKCTREDLKGFSSRDESQYDLDNPFDKYFSANAVIRVIERYQSGEIDDRFLASWAYDYMYIITGNFKVYHEGNSTSLKEFLIFEVIDWLDSLSFFDKEVEEYFNFNELKIRYKKFEKIYRNVDECSAVFLPDDSNEDLATVLIQNKAKKYYALVQGGLAYDEWEGQQYIVEFDRVDKKQLNRKIIRLIKQGYTKISW